jgi:hypothetical protein
MMDAVVDKVNNHDDNYYDGYEQRDEARLVERTTFHSSLIIHA